MRDPDWAPSDLVDPAPRLLHSRLGGDPAPLRSCPSLAARLGVGRVSLKDERSRFGLPSFKALGASWAVCSELAERLSEPELAVDPERLRERLATVAPLTLTCATEGNHGRAVAWMASVLGLRARVLVPAGMAEARVRALAAEGARVEVVDGDYDATVERAARLADAEHVVISDMAWTGYDNVPRRVIEGYATAFAELGAARPDLVLVPIGTGMLAAACADHLRSRESRARLVGVEPGVAACALESVVAGQRVRIPGPHESVMAGLNCGTVSPVAWPAVSRGFDAFCAIHDADADDGMRRLAGIGLDAGSCAGAALGAACRLLAGADSGPARRALGIDADAHVLVLLTEGVTDAEHFEAVVGRAPNTRPGDERHATSAA